MISLLFLWSLLFLLFYWMGNGILFVLLRGNLSNYLEEDILFLSLWLGLLASAVIFLALSVISPLYPAWLLLIGGIGIALFLVRDSPHTKSVTEIIIPCHSLLPALAIIMVGTSFYCCRAITWFDTGMYHLQSIKWLSRYGAVPGLALLHSRFGFTSSWFALSAPFNHGFLEGRVTALANGMILILIMLHVTVCVRRILEALYRPSDLFLMFGFGALLILAIPWRITSSASPDFSVITCTIFFGWILIVLSEIPARGSEKNNEGLLLLIVACAAFSIKPSASPLLPVAVWFYLSHPFSSKRLLCCILVTVGILLPFVSVSSIQSGYPFYPSGLFGLDLPWSLGRAKIHEEQFWITEYARWSRSIPPMWANSWNWVLPWLTSDLLENKVFLLFTLAMVVSTALLYIRKDGKFSGNDRLLLFTGWTGLALCFVKAPELRFGLGYSILPTAWLASKISFPKNMPFFRINPHRLILSSVISAMLVILSLLWLTAVPDPWKKLVGNYNAEYEQPFKDYDLSPWVVPPKIVPFAQVWHSSGRNVSRLEPVRIQRDTCENFEYNYPVNTQACWDAPLPCAPGPVSEIILRNSSQGLGSGFMKSEIVRERRSPLDKITPRKTGNI